MHEASSNPWKKLASRSIYENPWISVEEHDVLNPAGSQGIYGKVHFKNKAIGVIPVDANQNTWLVGQHRYTLNAFSWEIPEGGCPMGTDPLVSAQRELREETGMRADQWTLLMRIHTSNSVTDEEGFIFLAQSLHEGEQELEPTEADLVVKKLPLKEAIQLVIDGEITDSLSVAGLLRAARLLEI